MPLRISEILRILASGEDGRRPVYNILADIFEMLDQRIAVVEGVSSSLQELQADLQEAGQDIVDTALDPVVASITAKADLGALLTATSVSEIAVGTGLRTLVVTPAEARSMFAPAHTLSIVSADNRDIAMYARRVSFDPVSGELTVDVLAAIGTGTLTSWTISPGSLATMATAITVAPEGGIAGPTLQLALGQIKALLDSKSEDGHGHVIEEVDGLPEALSGLAVEIDGIQISLSAFSTTLSTKANSASPTFTGTVALPSTTSIGNVGAAEIAHLDGVTSGIQTQINAKAPLANPTFTGTATVPTARLTTTGDITLAGTAHAFQIGANNSFNLAFSRYAIQARENGAAADISINAAGGNVTLSGAGYSTYVEGDMMVTGSMFANASGWLTAPNFATELVSGWGLYQVGSLYLARSGGVPIMAQRRTSWGAIAQWWYGNTAVGSVSVTASATTYNTSSDERLKEDFQPIDADIIDQIAVYDFAWKVDGSRAYGVKAQELYQVVPTAVFRGDDPEVDMWAADYSKLVPLLIQAVKDLRQEVATLKAQLAA